MYIQIIFLKFQGLNFIMEYYFIDKYKNQEKLMKIAQEI